MNINSVYSVVCYSFGKLVLMLFLNSLTKLFAAIFKLYEKLKKSFLILIKLKI